MIKIKILSTHLNEDQLLTAQAIVLGVGSGTFIYVAVVDILPSEFSHGDDKDKFWKFLLLLVGVLAICVVVTVFTHSHDEID